MAMPLLVLTGIMTLLTAPGLIAQHLQKRREQRAAETQEGSINA